MRTMILLPSITRRNSQSLVTILGRRAVRRHQEKKSKKDDSDSIQRNFEQYSCDGGGAIYSTIVCIRNNSSMYGVASSGGRDHNRGRPLVLCSVLSVCAWKRNAGPKSNLSTCYYKERHTIHWTRLLAWFLWTTMHNIIPTVYLLFAGCRTPSCCLYFIFIYHHEIISSSRWWWWGRWCYYKLPT